MSSIAIKLNEKIVRSAREVGQLEHRSAPKQLEYWATIGKIAVENPDLTYEFIHDILLGNAQLEAGDIEKYVMVVGD